MALFKKKADPITDRARVLSAEIAALEAQIRDLDSQAQQNQAQPRLRSTALPQGVAISHPTQSAVQVVPAPAAEEPIFEPVDQNRLKARSEVVISRNHFNELGVRKYDLPALLRRIQNHFRGPTTTNPKLVHYLAAGGVQGLRPMRYEKRVARNRFIFFACLLFFSLLGFLLWLASH